MAEGLVQQVEALRRATKALDEQHAAMRRRIIGPMARLHRIGGLPPKELDELLQPPGEVQNR